MKPIAFAAIFVLVSLSSSHAQTDDQAGMRVISILRCAQIAGRAEKKEEQKRLFALGTDLGRKNGGMQHMIDTMLKSSNEVERMYGEQTSVDWWLGTIFANVTRDVDVEIGEKDDTGTPLPIDKRIVDADQRKWKAERFYRKENCALLR
jgi:hypothetical protein